MPKANAVTESDLDRVWVAINQAVGDDEDSKRVALVKHGGDALVLEAGMWQARRVSLRKRTGDELAERDAWLVHYGEDAHTVEKVTDTNGKPVSRKRVGRLNEALWRFHRLAVEDAAALIRS
jgi:hypothetical protein